MSDLLIIVPVRGASKRLPGKHAALLHGKTLLERTAAAIADADLGAPCLLTTDDAELAERGRRLGWWVPFQRPEHLARDNTPTADAVLHALDWYVGAGNPEPNYLMLVQTTSPLRTGQHLRGALQMLRDHADADAVVGVYETDLQRHGPYWVDAQGFLFAREAAPAARRVQPNGAVYVIRPARLRRASSFFAPKTLAFLMDTESSIDIDTQDDWRAAEAMLALRARGRPAR